MDTDGVSGKGQTAAEETDEWLRDEFESISLDEIRAKHRDLKKVWEREARDIN